MENINLKSTQMNRLKQQSNRLVKRQFRFFRFFFFLPILHVKYYIVQMKKPAMMVFFTIIVSGSLACGYRRPCLFTNKNISLSF